MWRRYVKRESGARLSGKVMAIFATISLVPVIIIAIFSGLFLRYISNSWFNQNAEDVFVESGSVATEYIKEHQLAVQNRATLFASELDTNIHKYDLQSNPRLFADVMSSLAQLVFVSEAAVFQGAKPIATTNRTHSLKFESFSDEQYAKASMGQVVIMNDYPDRVRAMVRLNSLPRAFLVIGQLINAQTLDQLNRASKIATQYQSLKIQFERVKQVFIAHFVAFSAFVALVTIFVSQLFARAIIGPILELAQATRSVVGTDFSAAKVALENSSNDEIGDLLSAFNVMLARIADQRLQLIQTEKYSAWSSVASTVAHEIKNPLTPIRLSAELIEAGGQTPEATAKYAANIILHAQDIERIVREFMRFARMPAAELRRQNLSDIVIAHAEVCVRARPDISYQLNIQPQCWIDCDHTQINQLLSNLTKNAEEAIDSRGKEKSISISLTMDASEIVLAIADSGGGFQFPISSSLETERPIVTTKPFGSGLGLAVVKKVVADHFGKLTSESSPNGMIIKITFQQKHELNRP